MIDQPLDILIRLDHVAATPPDGLEGVLDTEHAGVIGYSFDGYNALAMSGARIDSAYYLGNCPTPDATTAALLGLLSAFDCAPASEWDAYVVRAGDAVAPGEDGLWRPMSDERIRAAMPMAGEGWWLFGERGLAAVDRPVSTLAATGDFLYAENAAIYYYLGDVRQSVHLVRGPGSHDGLRTADGGAHGSLRDRILRLPPAGPRGVRAVVLGGLRGRAR